MTEIVTTRLFPPRRPRDWQRLHRLARILSDSVALVAGVVVASIVVHPTTPLSSLIWCAGLCAVWLVGLAVADSRDPRVVGTGVEFTRVLRATSWTAGAVAVAGWLVVPEGIRTQLLVAGAIGTAALIVSRLVWQRVLVGARRSGRCAERVLVVGSAGSIERIANDLRRDRARRTAVVDAFVVPPASGPGGAGDVVRDVLAAAQRSVVDTVLVTATDALCPDVVRRLEWVLRECGVDLAVAPTLGEVAAHRLRHRNIAGRPVIHLRATERPGAELLKRGVDIVGSSVLIVALAPVLVAVAVTVAVTSRGPVLYRQERIGRRGRPFDMLKFRSMRAGADAELEGLLAASGPVDRPLFKVRDDPRITPVGRVLRRYSLDELPQLFNVLAGSMSLVGPRPQRAAEVALYDEVAHRRLLVRPGMSGLWQVEGRSSLPWDEAIRLDLYYVDNRSVCADLHILCRTARAVAAPGADEAH